MNATEIIDQKIMDHGTLRYRRAIWEFQRHPVGLAIVGEEGLQHAMVASLNAMAEHADRLIVLCTSSSEMAHSLASLHHVDGVHLLAPKEVADLMFELKPEVVYSAPGFVDPELPEDAVRIRIL
ncbi:hypothetical protein GC167_01115 [bacterium]|nr:hypothetical protein [bacterium]